MLSSINSGIELVQKAIKFADELKNVELKELILEMKKNLLDVQEECLTLREKNAKLIAENKRLSAAPKVQVKDGLYYLAENGDGPFCTGCYDTKNGITVRLAKTMDDVQQYAGLDWECPSCKAAYRGRIEEEGRPMDAAAMYIPPNRNF